jgi:hypothetical protein
MFHPNSSDWESEIWYNAGGAVYLEALFKGTSWMEFQR